MSLGWSILLIVLGGLAACGLYVAVEGSEHLRGARQLIEEGRDAAQARRWRDGE